MRDGDGNRCADQKEESEGMMASDSERLRWLMENCVEGIAGPGNDRYGYAMQIAEREGHAEPTATDELDGFRQMIDDAMDLSTLTLPGS